MQRGVYRMPFRDAGGLLLALAVAANGRRVAEMAFAPCGEDETTRALWQMLDRADPLPPPPPDLV
jgi:hypothetical protein